MAQAQIAERQAGAVAETNTVSMFERLAKDPSVDVAKLEKLMELSERARAQQAKGAYAIAMAEAQAEIRPIAADANNPQTRSKYASYAALDRALRPVYTRHGFALSFGTGDTAKPEHVRVTCEVSHIGGHTSERHIDMPADGKGAKGGDVMTKTHATGSAASYGMRYLLKMIFNVAVGEDDDDGNSAADVGPRITDDQAANLDSLIDGCVPPRKTEAESKKAREQTVYKFLKALSSQSKLTITRIEDIPAKVYEDAVIILKNVGAAK